MKDPPTKSVIADPIAAHKPGPTLAGVPFAEQDLIPRHLRPHEAVASQDQAESH